jgi:hypothetical protein
MMVLSKRWEDTPAENGVMIKETGGYESRWHFHIPVIILILTDFSHRLIDELANPYTRYKNDDLP